MVPSARRRKILRNGEGGKERFSVRRLLAPMTNLVRVGVWVRVRVWVRGRGRGRVRVGVRVGVRVRVGVSRR